jgi:uncharacterized ferritin-like protein (DUF455 family)
VIDKLKERTRRIAAIEVLMNPHLSRVVEGIAWYRYLKKGHQKESVHKMRMECTNRGGRGGLPEKKGTKMPGETEFLSTQVV